MRGLGLTATGDVACDEQGHVVEEFLLGSGVVCEAGFGSGLGLIVSGLGICDDQSGGEDPEKLGAAGEQGFFPGFSGGAVLRGHDPEARVAERSDAEDDEFSGAFAYLPRGHGPETRGASPGLGRGGRIRAGLVSPPWQGPPQSSSHRRSLLSTVLVKRLLSQPCNSP